MSGIEIPWGQIGAFGSFAIIVLAIVLYFVFKSKKARNNPGTINRQRCINNPRFQTSLTNIEMTKESMQEMKGDMKVLREKAVEQTTILNNIHNQAIDQTKVLTKICAKTGKR